ncbi:MAG: hypothetical protein HRT89_09695 [Lentisphaeria bacterium]|nr:hypothetical protein [Lentisphaeria bacterium]NQZ68333.1 hypothetical protein [Lentisphaeria bacterium]
MKEIIESSPWLIPLFGIPLFILIWIFICRVLALTGGWSKISRIYPMTDCFPHRRYGMQSIQLRMGIGYSNCVTIGLGENAVFFKTMIFSNLDMSQLKFHMMFSQLKKGDFYLYPILIFCLGMNEYGFILVGGSVRK